MTSGNFVPCALNGVHVLVFLMELCSTGVSKIIHFYYILLHSTHSILTTSGEWSGSA